MESFLVAKINSFLNYDLNPRDFLDEDEYEYLKRQRQVNHVHDYLFVPTHSKNRKTYRIQKVFTDDLNITDFVYNIISLISKDFEIAIDLGYFAFKPLDPDSLR